MERCRYLEHLDGEAYCVYWDLSLRRNEDLRCYPNGSECYEEPGGCIFEGRWMTLTEYAEHLESKSERELPEGYECQEFCLDNEGLADLSGWEKHYFPVGSMTGEFHFLKIRPEYPKSVKAVAIAHLHYDTEVKRLYFDRPAGCQWMASLWISDETCQIDLAVVLKEDRLEWIEAYCGCCLDGDLCPGVEKMKQAVLESEAFALLREDLTHELFQRMVADLDPPDPLPSPRTVPPGEEDEHLRP